MINRKKGIEDGNIICSNCIYMFNSPIDFNTTKHNKSIYEKEDKGKFH